MTSLLEMLPFNIGLLVLSPENLRGLRRVSVLDIFQNGKNFHSDGLFSIETFGKVGDERRNRLFGYMDLNLPILHPVIYKALVDLKELYGQIMAGNAYAVFDEKLKDFVAAPVSTGQTGYQFFLSHFNQLVFEERESTSREFLIKLVYQERERCMMDKLIVMPAGLRDFTIAPNGKPEKDEINDLYQRTLSIANIVGSHGKLSDAEHMDATRYRLQLSVCEIYDYIVNLLEGKTKLIQGWWTNRSVFNSTRNVITANVQTSPEAFGPTSVGPNETIVGLYQAIQGTLPISISLIRGQAENVFSGPNSPATLVNKKTLEAERVQVSPDYFDEWMTQEGIESMIGRFEVELTRHDPIIINDHYLCLTYNDGKHVRLVHGKQDLPDNYSAKYLTPTTYAEFYYLAVFQRIKELPAFVVRYPITGYGSIYPGFPYIKSTTRAVCLELLGDDWQTTGIYANEFPINGLPFVNSMSPHTSHLGKLGADERIVEI